VQNSSQIVTTNNPTPNLFTGWTPFQLPKQPCQRTERNTMHYRQQNKNDADPADIATIFSFCSTSSKEEPLGTAGAQLFYRMNVFPVTQPTVSKH